MIAISTGLCQFGFGGGSRDILFCSAQEVSYYIIPLKFISYLINLRPGLAEISDMLLFLSKFLPPLVYPLGLACEMVLAALFLGRRPRLQRLVLLAVISILLIASNRWVADSLVRSLEWRY